MDAKDRFLSTMLYGKGPVPNLEFFGPWGETMARWLSEGLDPIDPWGDLRQRTGLGEGYQTVPVNLGILPAFEHMVLEETDRFTRTRGSDGIVRRQLKGTDNMPSFEAHPVASWDDWEEYKGRLNPDDPSRFPADWESLVANWDSRTYPLALGEYPYGFFGTPRDILGVERLLVGFYDSPELIHDIMETLCDLWCSLWAKVLSQVRVDFVQIWEDMLYKNGPLISPAMFREFMAPCYKRLLGVARDFGVEVAFVDTDGDCRALIGPMMECGVTGLYPFEAAAGMDIVDVAHRYPRLHMVGGIDKMEIAKGPSAIDAELARKMPAMLARGGYIPSLDHLCPPEVSLEDFVYYRRRVTEYIQEYSG